MLARYWRTKLEDEGLIITPEDARLARLKRRIIVIGSLVLVFQFFSAFSARDQLAVPLKHGRRDATLRRHSPSSIKSNGATRALKRSASCPVKHTAEQGLSTSICRRRRDQESNVARVTMQLFSPSRATFQYEVHASHRAQEG